MSLKGDKRHVAHGDCLELVKAIDRSPLRAPIGDTWRKKGEAFVSELWSAGSLTSWKTSCAAFVESMQEAIERFFAANVSNHSCSGSPPKELLEPHARQCFLERESTNASKTKVWDKVTLALKEARNATVDGEGQARENLEISRAETARQELAKLIALEMIILPRPK